MRQSIRSGLLVILCCLVTAEALAAVPKEVWQDDWVADVAQKVIPAVVNIASVKTVAVEQSPYFSHPFFGDLFGSIPQEQVKRALGSGVIVSSDGYIITNDHVVAGADKVEVRLADNRVLTARIIGTDPKSDVAVVKIEARGLPTVPIGDSSKLRIGSFVLAVGNPFGLGQTVTMGIVSALGRSGLGITDYENFIQTDAAINPGNSGGALINMKGELVGINTAILSRSGGNVGIGFAIPVDLAMSVKNSLVRYGKVVRGWLGVTAQDMDAKIAKSLGMAVPKGILVADVAKGSPAALAGIQRGDVILAVNGNPVASPTALRFAVSEQTPGAQIKMTLFRSGREFTVPVTVGDLAKATSIDASFLVKDNRFLAGLSAADISPALREQLNLAADLDGVIVTDVKRGSAAQSSGIQPGDIIMKLGAATIKNLADFKKALSSLSGRRMSITIYRGGMIMSSTIIR